MDKDIAVEVGRALRRVRMQRRLRLKDVGELSDRFTPTAVAGYERAERAISLVKYCELCAVYGVAPERLLADAIRAIDGRPPVVVDLS
ncbi:MAG: helix-turn-helix domain-containing protein, partial [Gaiellales bacterium]